MLAHRLPAHLGDRRTVLIVEDEPSIRDSLADLFEVDGTETVRAETLAEAQRALGLRRFDLIVTDIRLAGKIDGGLQVIGAAGLLSPDATVIALTAYPDDNIRLATFRLGAVHFFAKPVDLSTIADLAARYGVPSALHPAPMPPVTGGDATPSR